MEVQTNMNGPEHDRSPMIPTASATPPLPKEVTMNPSTSATPSGTTPAVAIVGPSTEPMDLTSDANPSPAPAAAPGAIRTSPSTSEMNSAAPSLGGGVVGVTGSATAASTGTTLPCLPTAAPSAAQPLAQNTPQPQPLPTHSRHLGESLPNSGAGLNSAANGPSPMPPAGPPLPGYSRPSVSPVLATATNSNSGPSPMPPISNRIPPSLPHMPSSASPQPRGPYTVDNIFGNTQGFPLAEDSPLTPQELVEECNNAYPVFDKTSGVALRRLVRDKWQKCLADSESHLSFVLNAVMDRAGPHSCRTAAGKFGANIVKHAARELVGHMTTDTLGELADIIVQKAPDNLLDAAMRRRLETISGRSLLNMLARAERLGYDQSDVVEEDEVPQFTNGAVAGAQSRGSFTYFPAAPVPSPMSTTTIPQIGQSSGLVCRLCLRTFPNPSALRHHGKKRVCQKPPVSSKYFCPSCGQSFATKTGLDYHVKNNVCGTSQSPARQSASPVVLSSDGSSRGSPGVTAPTQPPPSQAAFKNPVPTPTPSSRPMSSQAQAIPSTPTPNAAKPVSSTPSSYAHQPSVHQEAYSHLSQNQLDAMVAELKACQAIYDGRMDDARRAGLMPTQLQQKLDSLKNCSNTMQSGIRKRYGVNLRTKRPRVSTGDGQAGNSSAVPSPSWAKGSMTHSNKKRRVSVVGQYPNYGVQETPVRKQAGPEVAAPAGGSGLMASAATPEMTDPTKARPGEYSSYLPAQKTANGASTLQTPHQQPRPASGGAAKSASSGPMKPLPKLSVVELSSDGTYSDSGDSIPAQLPPPPVRADAGPLKRTAL